jgi:hypothetical protein
LAAHSMRGRRNRTPNFPPEGFRCAADRGARELRQDGARPGADPPIPLGLGICTISPSNPKVLDAGPESGSLLPLCCAKARLRNPGRTIPPAWNPASKLGVQGGSELPHSRRRVGHAEFRETSNDSSPTLGTNADLKLTGCQNERWRRRRMAGDGGANPGARRHLFNQVYLFHSYRCILLKHPFIF